MSEEHVIIESLMAECASLRSRAAEAEASLADFGNCEHFVELPNDITLMWLVCPHLKDSGLAEYLRKLVARANAAEAQLATARALHFAEMERRCLADANNATLDTTGVERKTLQRIAENCSRLAPLPSTLRAVEVSVLAKIQKALEMPYAAKVHEDVIAARSALDVTMGATK